MSVIKADSTVGVIYGNSYYSIVDGPTWASAKAQSQNLGGYLASINDIEENNFIANEFSNSQYYYNGDSAISEHTHFWLGGSDSESEGIWKRDSGETWFDNFVRQH